MPEIKAVILNQSAGAPWDADKSFEGCYKAWEAK